MEGIETIYCIGDSHASFFSGYDEIQPAYPERSSNKYAFFKGYRLGSVLAYSLASLDTREQGREKLFDLVRQLPEGARILMCFGEIDCRCHLLKQADIQQRPVQDIVESCVGRYFKVIDELIELKFKVAVWNALPSANSTNIEYPTYGSMEERNKCSILFNAALNRECGKRSIAFLSIFDKLINKDLTSRTVYFFDGIHLGQMAMPMVLRKFYSLDPGLIKRYYSLHEIQVKIVIARGRRVYRSIKQFLSLRENARLFSEKLLLFIRKRRKNHYNIF